MIPNHKQFIEAIKEKKKVSLRFYSIADRGVIDLICAPMDYGPGAGFQEGVNRYWLWDYTGNTGTPSLGLLPEQVLDIQVLGGVFDPAQIEVTAPQWSIPRDWGSQSGPNNKPMTGASMTTIQTPQVASDPQPSLAPLQPNPGSGSTGSLGASPTQPAWSLRSRAAKPEGDSN